jgi:antitoxin (DNA-binding transcriptional repressor) of toxin-antitoxin stability system
MEKLIGLKEFRENVEAFTRQINKGHSFIVLKKSKPVFKVSPFTEEEWEEVIDFTKLKRGGIKIKDLLARL